MPKRLLRQNPPNNHGQASLTPAHLVTEGHSGLSTISVDSMGSMTDPGPFPFFKLPAEIRNMIYRLVVITGERLRVRDMHREEFKKSQEDGTYQSRSTYLALDHECSSGRLSFDSCVQTDPGSEPTKITYTYCKLNPVDIRITSMLTTTTSMLAIDKQSRDEVASFFYGGNSFHFTSMSSLVPFMKDRTVETRKYIQNLYLTLILDAETWNVVYAEYGLPAIWNSAFSSVLKLSHVNIRKLCIHIIDNVGLKFDGDLRSRSMLWLHKLSRFDNLEMLGLQYTPGILKALEQGVSLEELLRKMVGEIEYEPVEELWRFLAPKMLKRESDDHSPDALRQRRICNFGIHGRRPSIPTLWP